MDVSSTTFREVMAGVATPVTVVTATNGDRPHGTTVSAFASLSVTPPMVLVALDRDSELLAVVRTRRRFGVNVLGSAQSALALAFARKGSGKFVGVPYEIKDGLPRILHVTGWLACDLADLLQGGDHLIALGAVTSASSLGGSPLTYHARGFGTHMALDWSADHELKSRLGDLQDLAKPFQERNRFQEQLLLIGRELGADRCRQAVDDAAPHAHHPVGAVWRDRHDQPTAVVRVDLAADEALLFEHGDQARRRLPGDQLGGGYVRRGCGPVAVDAGKQRQLSQRQLGLGAQGAHLAD